MKSVLNIIQAVVLAGFFVLVPARPVPAETGLVKVGVLAKRGAEITEQRWNLMGNYLEAHVPGYSFLIIPLDFVNVRRAVEKEEVDFILTNSGYYIELEAAYGVSRIATLKNMLGDQVATTFGGVIFTQAGRKDINRLTDLKGKSFMAADKVSLGGWRMAWRELKDAGLDPARDFNPLSFGGTHDAVVYAVLEGRVDAGTARTDTIERMAAEGKVDPAAFKVLGARSDQTGFPFLLSTRLYPEWPWAKLEHTPDDLAEKVAIALLSMGPDEPAAREAQIAGWTVPLDYKPVHALMRELHLGPYQDLGRVRLEDVVREYLFYMLGGLAVVLFLTGTTGYVVRLNRKLERTRADLNRAYDQLEERVRQRTAQLSWANERLLDENTERRRIEEELRRQKDFNDNIIHTASAMILTLDEEARITEFNDHAEWLTGYIRSEVMGRDFAGLFIPESQRSAYYQFFRDFYRGVAGQSEHENEVLCRDGSVRTVSWRNSFLQDAQGRALAVLLIGVDVTDRRRAEKLGRLQREQLIQADKMVALGTLVAGVAHEINNPTTAIMMNAPNIARMWRGLEPILDQHLRENGDFEVGNWSYIQLRERVPLLLEGIHDGARRVKRIVADLKDFARHEGATGAVPIDVNQAVDRSLSLLSNMIKKSTKDFRLDKAEELPRVLARSQRIEQVIINLVMNACQALADDTKGIRVSTAYDPETVTVRVTVEDDGMGIAPENLSRVTDPFFTTKRETGGTGLGLAICSTIVGDHGGSLQFESRSGQGTRATMALPAWKKG
ncbi:MAG: PhnD/SsuA/transferrin family substrate-binding protein [Thermodesulfobacteriota bacterium]